MSEPLKVLVVEDEAAVMLLLAALVEDEGHELVGTAMSSKEAIATIERTSPHLLLLDLNLKDGHTGLDVAQIARRAGAQIVFMTANASQVADFAGALGVLAKPFSRAAVIATLRFVAESIQDPPPKVRRPPEFAFA